MFVLNAVDGCIPSDLATGTTPEIEEERRLLYVAMTRAKDQLASDRAAALLHAWAAQPRRPPRLCAAHALHSEWADRPFPEPVLAAARNLAVPRAFGSYAASM